MLLSAGIAASITTASLSRHYVWLVGQQVLVSVEFQFPLDLRSAVYICFTNSTNSQYFACFFINIKYNI